MAALRGVWRAVGDAVRVGVALFQVSAEGTIIRKNSCTHAVAAGVHTEVSCKRNGGAKPEDGVERIQSQRNGWVTLEALHESCRDKVE